MSAITGTFREVSLPVILCVLLTLHLPLLPSDHYNVYVVFHCMKRQTTESLRKDTNSSFQIASFNNAR